MYIFAVIYDKRVCETLLFRSFYLLKKNNTMLKDMKTVGVLLLLSAISAGTAYAVPKWGTAGVKEIQQNGVCNGVVTDTTGETVIGASVVVKGTTNGTITGLDGDFSLSGVTKGSILVVSFVGYQNTEVKGSV